jgi:hypothetical protein
MSYYQSSTTVAPTSGTVPAAASSPLRRRDIGVLRREIQHYFTGEVAGGGTPTPIFDYVAILTRILRTCSYVLAEHLPHYPTLKSELDKISVVNTIASGEEWMVPYEISFEANMAEYRAHTEVHL